MRTKSSALISRENNTAQEQNTEQIDAVGAETAASAVEAGLRIHGTAHQIGLLLLLRFNLPIARNTTSSFPPRRPAAASCAGPQIEQGRGRRACRRHQQLAPCGVPCLHLARAQAARAPPRGHGVPHRAGTRIAAAFLPCQAQHRQGNSSSGRGVSEPGVD
jgi:hypothetical protein